MANQVIDASAEGQEAMNREATLYPQLQHIHTILLDMDGVVTSEACYWDAARLTVLEILGNPRYVSCDPVGFDLQVPRETLLERGRHLLSDETIAEIKAYAISTNWDVAYVMASLYLIYFSVRLMPADREQLDRLLMGYGWSVSTLHSLPPFFWGGQSVPEGGKLWSDFARFLGERRGFEAIQALNDYWGQWTGLRSTPFQRGNGFWRFCQKLFQAWYLGDDLYQEIYGQTVEDPGRQGLIHQEQPLLPPEQVRETLTSLRDAGVTLGIATGRPHREIVTPLEQMGLFSFFAPDRIATHREVEAAEAELRDVGIEAQLAKPHPFLFLRALYPSLSARDIWEENYPTGDHSRVAVVGDAVSDVAAAHAIGCYSVSVLTGAGGTEQEEALRTAGTNLIIPDVTCLKHDE